MELKVNVTAACISLGCKKDGFNCPVARAVMACLPNAWAADVGEDDVDINTSPRSKWVRVPLPKKVREFIGAFDKGLEVRPFSFTLNVPKEFST